MTDKKKRLNVLALDGGGIRGIVPALILQEIERRTGNPISKLFDVIAGTSTGGILGLALSKPHPDKPLHPHFSTTDLVNLYKYEGNKFFPKNPLRNVVSAVYGAKFPEKGLQGLLVDRFGDTMLSQALTDMTIATYDLEYRRGFFFKSEKARHPRTEDEYDFLMRDVARATSAAPTYFKPASVRAKGSGIDWHLVDGGVCANNPSLVGYTEAMRIHGHDDICLVSIGTGELTDPLPIHKARRWGMAQWAMPAVDVMFDGVTHTTHYQLDTLLDEWDYYRFQPWLEGASDSMEDVSPENIQGLVDVVGEWLDQENDSSRTHIKNSRDRQSKRTNRLNHACEHIVNNMFHLSLDDLSEACRIPNNELLALLDTLPDRDLIENHSTYIGGLGYSEDAINMVKAAYIAK